MILYKGERAGRCMGAFHMRYVILGVRCKTSRGNSEEALWYELGEKRFHRSMVIIRVTLGLLDPVLVGRGEIPGIGVFNVSCT